MLNLERPNFDFSVPIGYDWLKDVCAIGYHPFSPLRPWYYASRWESFELKTKWVEGEMVRLVVFASRQDTDDYACFVVKKQQIIGIVEIHTTSRDNFEITATYQKFWDWLKAIIDDIALVAEIAVINQDVNG